MRSRIQRQLSRLQRPDFIHSLEVGGWMRGCMGVWEGEQIPLSKVLTTHGCLSHAAAAAAAAGRLQVVAVDCGGAAPTLHNLASLPQPDAAIWPQLVFDMRYEGEWEWECEIGRRGAATRPFTL